MSIQVKQLSKRKKSDMDKYANYLQDEITASAVSTYTENEIETGCSMRAGLAMEIHQVEICVSVPEAPTDKKQGPCTTAELWSFGGRTGAGNVGQRGHIAGNMMMLFTTDTARTAENIPASKIGQEAKKEVFDPPLLYARPKIYFSCIDNHATTPMEASLKITFTWVKLTPTEFIEAMETWAET